MSKKSDGKNIIGKVWINNTSELESWLKDEKLAEKYIKSNWSDKCIDWEQSDKIGFYELIKVVPHLHDATNNIESSWRRNDLLDEINYNNMMNIPFGLIYSDDKFCVFCSAKNVYLLPIRFVNVELHKDYSNISMSRLRKITSSTSSGMLPADLNDISVSDVENMIQEKKDLINKKQAEIQSLKDEKQAELEAFKKELEERFREKEELLNSKMNEFQIMKENLEKQIYVLESEIYGIRCYTGEVVDFRNINSGKHANIDEPLVIYQKLRYLDEELGKLMSIYDFSGFDEDIKYFENLLKARKDIQELFAPGERSLSILKVSKSGKTYSSSDIFANILASYEKYHGQTLAILLKDGENLWITWLDEDKITITDGYVFFSQKEQSVTDESDIRASSTVQEKLSRYFIFSILQGLVDSNKLISFPEKVDVMKPNRYIVFSSADNWLVDDRYGDFSDIINRTKCQLKKGDMVLTMQHITRDDACNYGNNSTRYQKFCNDRGRGEKNRTHDVSISNCTIYPINHIDVDKTYSVYILAYPFNTKEIKTPCKSGGWYISYDFTELQGPPTILKKSITLTNDMICNEKISKSYASNMDDFFKWYLNFFCDGYEKPITDRLSSMSFFEHNENIRGVFYKYYSYDEPTYEYSYFISEEKEANWQTGKRARANMQIYEDEVLNLTFLNSVYIRYAITNNKVKGWRIGGSTVDFAYAIRYLNTALKYLDKREMTEAEMLKPYMELYDDWQVDLSEWRLKNNYHSLTPTRAKTFAKQRQTLDNSKNQ